MNVAQRRVVKSGAAPQTGEDIFGIGSGQV